MSQKEMIEEIDKDSVEYLLFALRTFSKKKYYNEALKHDGPCTFRSVYWTSKRKNNYLFVPYSNSKADTRKFKGICWVSIVYYFDEHGKLNAIMQSYMSTPWFITSHLFDRYAERYLDDYTLSKLEVMARFVRHNFRFADIPLESSKFPDAIISKANEGVVLGTKQGDILTLKTFITNDMLKGSELMLVKESEEKMKINKKKIEQFDELCLFLNEIL